MKKPTLISALAIATLATAGLALPATASASPNKHEETRVVRHDHQRDHNVRRVHDVDRRYIESHRDYRSHGQTRWAPSRHHHDRGHHYGHQRKHSHRYDYRPVERYRHRHDDDLRVRIFYDFHL